MRFVFWLPRPSLHVTPLAEALMDIGADEVITVADNPPLAARAQLGAGPRAARRISEIVAPSIDQRKNILRADANTFHYFAGLGVYRGVSASLRMSTPAAGTRAVFMESLRSDDRLAAVRPWRYRARWWRMNARVDCVLAAGQDAIEQTAALFGAQATVHEFGYFVDSPSQAAAQDPADNWVSVCYVGQLVDRKNVRLLIRAMGQMRTLSLSLTVAGDGAQRKELELAAAGENLRAKFVGAVPNSQVRHLIADHDVLVLPSKFDGWGAVVNEALLAGTRVVVSDAVGSRSLISSSRQGAVFASNDADSLRKALQSVVTCGPARVADREALKREAVARFSPTAGARYLAEIARAPAQPHTPPWRVGDGRSKGVTT